MLEILNNDRFRLLLKAICLAYWALSLVGTLIAPDPWRMYACVALAFIVTIHGVETVAFAGRNLRSDNRAVNGFAQSLIFGILWNYRYLKEDGAA